MTEHQQEISQGERFEFGKNWTSFLKVLDDERIHEAELSLKNMLEVQELSGKRFLDIGSGSGLFSLAARRLGAIVYSFDYDPRSVACAQELKRRYFSNDPDWKIDSGSVLDERYLGKLGRFDIVYSWGVLHHTGDMWQALGNISSLVVNGGNLFIAIYNNQGRASKRWLLLKRLYNKYLILRTPLAIYTLIRAWTLTVFKDSLKGYPLKSWNNYKLSRGMSAWHDVVDWIGGYPFEVAKPEEIFDFYRERGFELKRLKTMAGGIGCNEYVFEKSKHD